MGFFEIFSIVFLILSAVILFMIIMGLISKTVCIKKADKKIKVKAQNRAVMYMWLGLSSFQIFDMFVQMAKAAERGELSRERDCMFFAVAWIMFFIYCLLMIIFGRYAYVTEEHIIIADVIRAWKSKDNCRYKINGETVEIYYKKLNTPWKFDIIESKDELIEMLGNNYFKYKENDYENL